MKLAINGGRPVRKKPFTQWPIWGKEEEKGLLRVLKSGKWWMYAYGATEHGQTKRSVHGEKSQVELLEEEFAEYHRAGYAYAVSSGSCGLEICVRACNILPGDEVITTPYTFIATSLCVLNQGGIPVYVDIDPDTYNINPDLIEEAITPRTKAIIPVHFAGELADMTKITHIAQKHNLKVIEDSAQAQGASLKGGRFAGTLGDMGIFSFQQSKNMTAGEGGMVTTNNKELAELAWTLRHYGRTPGGLWYEHFRLGWNFRMSEFQATVLRAQLGRLKSQTELRMKNVKYFYEQIEDIEGLTPCKVIPEAEKRAHYLVILKYDKNKWQGVSRDVFIKALSLEGIPVSSGYSFPNYANPLFKSYKIDYSKYSKTCPVAEKACREEALWFSHQLFLGDRNDVDDIVCAIRKIKNNISELKGGNLCQAERCH